MASRIPQSFLDDLLVRADIVDVIDSRVPLKKAGKDYKACCPFHEEKTPSFTVSPDKQFYHCFGCGAHGTAIGFLMEYDHMSFPEAVEELAARAGLEVPREGTAAPAPDGTEELLALMKQADRYYRRQLREHPRAGEAVDYLKGRGLSGGIAAEFGLGYAPEGWDNLVQALGADESSRQRLVRAGLAVKKDSGGYYDRFRGRVMFPIHDYRGRVVGFGGRVLGAGEPKYLNSPETPVFHKGREIYGLYRAREAIRRRQQVLVVEGYMDVVALAQFGIDYACATLGTATTREHLERVFRHAPEVVFCFDGDEAGRKAAWRALEQALAVLRDGRQVGFLFLPEGEDPDSMVRREGREAFEKRLGGAKPLPEYFFEELALKVDLQRLDGRARLVELARPLLAKLPPGVLKEMMRERLAQISRMDPEKLAKLLISGEKPPFRPMAAAERRRSGPRAGSPPTPTRLVRRAVALLLARPELAQMPETGSLPGALDLPGWAFFRELLDLLRSNPGLSHAGAVIERYRGSERQAHLQKLAAGEYPMAEMDLEAEFRDVLRKFTAREQEQRARSLLQPGGDLDDRQKAEAIKELLEKSRSGGNTPPEA